MIVETKDLELQIKNMALSSRVLLETYVRL